jgi:hypothetical protein
MGEREEAFLKKAPPLRKRDIEAINGLFDSYIFRRRSCYEVWTTCCMRHETLSGDEAIWAEFHVPQPKNSWDTRTQRLHDQTPCPFCGRMGTVKDIKYTGSRKNLWQERRFVLLRWDGRSLWAECGWARKDYARIERLTDKPMICPGSLYRFGKSAVEYTQKDWWGSYRTLDKEIYANFGKETVDEPFHWNSDEGLGYAVIGADAIAKTPARYCQAEEWIEHYNEFLKFLHLAYVYPRQVELLMKAGMARAVWDLAKRGVKHAAVLNWAEEDPRRAFKIDPQAVRDFLRIQPKDNRPIGMLELWKKLNCGKKRVSMELTAEVYGFFDGHRDAVTMAKKWHLEPMRLYRYLDGQNHCMVGSMYTTWRDYVNMGEQQGLALFRSDVLLPAELGTAHDAVVGEYNRRLQAERDHREAERKKREAEEQKTRAEAYEELRKKLERRYAWEADGYLILVPESEKAIQDEGRVLEHCVGGYAARHAMGKTVILFMRKAKAPKEPWLTIEMNGSQLKQIHGYRNEGLYTAKGRFAPDPREKYRTFLDPWLNWVAKGSRRKKDGTPIVPKTKKENVA